MNKNIIFIIGGARSGKSSYALKKASQLSGQKAFIATAEALDKEMQQRIEKHKQQRGRDWTTYEEPMNITKVLEEIRNECNVIILDCLTLWLSNIMHNNSDIPYEFEKLIGTLHTVRQVSYIFIVSNEVGTGIVPENESARRFRDLAGILNQRIAEIADEVYLMISGIPLKIKNL